MLDSLVRVSRRGKENHFDSSFLRPLQHMSRSQNKTAFQWQQKRRTTIVTQRPLCKHSGKYGTCTTDFLCFSFSNFRYSLTLFSKFFASFPHGTCTLSVSHWYLAFDGIYHLLGAAIPNNSTRRHLIQKIAKTGISPSTSPSSKELVPITSIRVKRPQFHALRTNSHFELFSLQSPLLRESKLVSFPPPNNMLKFSGSSWLTWDLQTGTNSAIQIEDTYHSHHLAPSDCKFTNTPFLQSKRYTPKVDSSSWNVALS
jgi:hypothetical protein